MKSILKAMLVVSAMSLATTVVPTHARADNFGIYFDTGSVAFAYRDGWWDDHHRWHRWRDRHEWMAYRDHYGDRYYDWSHDRDRDLGWRDREWRDWHDRRHDHDWHDRDRHDWHDRDWHDRH